MKFTKRLATDAEASIELKSHGDRYNQNNPGFDRTDEEWQAKQDEALAEGYKNEVCSCGCVFLAFHHYTMCSEEGCPFSDGVSLLDRMMKD